MATFTIPSTTLKANSSQTFGPWTIPVGATSADIVIDRTITNGLDAAASTETLTASWSLSTNSGPFVFMGGGGTVGGTLIDPDTGLTATTFEITVTPLPSPTAARTVQLAVTNTNRVAVAGTATLA